MTDAQYGEQLSPVETFLQVTDAMREELRALQARAAMWVQLTPLNDRIKPVMAMISHGVADGHGVSCAVHHILRDLATHVGEERAVVAYAETLRISTTQVMTALTHLRQLCSLYAVPMPVELRHAGPTGALQWAADSTGWPPSAVLGPAGQNVAQSAQEPDSHEASCQRMLLELFDGRITEAKIASISAVGAARRKMLARQIDMLIATANAGPDEEDDYRGADAD